MAAFPEYPGIPINRIAGGGYFTDVDPWGRTIASNLPPTHVLHLELERLNQKVETLQTEKEDLRNISVDLKRKVVELRARLRTEVPADTRPAHTALYQKIDSIISTADANILRAIVREVCRESEKAANIATSILPSPPSPDEEQINVPKAPSTTRTTSTRRTSVRFQEPPITAGSDRSTSTRRTSTRLQDPQVPTSSDRSAEQAEHIQRRRSVKTTTAEQYAVKQELTTPRRSKRRADEAEGEEQGSRKRRSTAPLVCTKCNKEYDASENMRGVCRKHSGYKDLDTSLDIWDDFDEYVHGRYDTYINDPEYAEGFIWSCCGQYSNIKKCTASKHSNK